MNQEEEVEAGNVNERMPWGDRSPPLVLPKPPAAAAAGKDQVGGGGGGSGDCKKQSQQVKKKIMKNSNFKANSMQRTFVSRIDSDFGNNNCSATESI